jgi:hypothetical protein
MDDKTRTELDQIKAQYEAAKTVKEGERLDKMYFKVDPAARAAWLADQAKTLFR